jgi:hypothetical protein
MMTKTKSGTAAMPLATERGNRELYERCRTTTDAIAAAVDGG